MSHERGRENYVIYLYNDLLNSSIWAFGEKLNYDSHQRKREEIIQLYHHKPKTLLRKSGE